MAISFVAAGAQWTDTTTNTSYTFNAPAGIADGDLLIGFTTRNTGATGNGTAPTGWTLVRTMYSGTTSAATMQVYWKIWHTGDPTTWTNGTMPGSSARRQTVVNAYRGAHLTVPFLVEDGTASTTDAADYASPTVNNTNPVAWRISAGATRLVSGTQGGYASSLGDTERSDARTATGSCNALATYDSNGTIATGNTTWTLDGSTTCDSGVAWIGIIVPAAVNVSPGTTTQTGTGYAAEGGVGGAATEYFRQEG